MKKWFEYGGNHEEVNSVPMCAGHLYRRRL